MAKETAGIVAESAAKTTETDSQDLRGHPVGYGATLWILAVVVFLAGMIIAQIGYGSSYSLSQNHISDLGALHCGTLSAPGPGGGYLYSGYVCSPWHDVFNATIAIQGVLLVLGVILSRRGFPSQIGRTIGFALLIAAGVGSVGVGVFPEDSIFILHSFSAALSFLAGNLALITLGFSQLTYTKWNAFRAYSILSGSIGLTAFFLFLTMVYGSLGVGGMERLIVDPALLWLVVTGVYLFRSDRSHLTASPDSTKVPTRQVAKAIASDGPRPLCH